MGERELEHFLAGAEHKAYHTAHAALWDREAALDVVQESMMRLVQYYRNRPDNEWPKLFHTILNSRINEARRKRMLTAGKLRLISLTGLGRREAGQGSDRGEAEIPSPQRADGISAPEAETLGGDLRQKIHAAIETLSWRQRQVFILREWRGHTIQATAQMLGCSENAVKQHHFRAMQTLRKQLSEVWEHG
ncbi:MAG: sigma-70 family RNA polymerase sigma factor [Gammaproteobacteria bacterium]